MKNFKYKHNIPRFTQKFHNLEHDETFWHIQEDQDEHYAIQKLGQLEDYEELLAERLDIEDFSLKFVLQAITGTVYYKDRDDKIVKAQSVSFSFDTGEFHLHRRNGTHFVDYEDYGTEWAFTKKELENALPKI